MDLPILPSIMYPMQRVPHTLLLFITADISVPVKRTCKYEEAK